MVIGILQFELLIHGPESLKDKRRVVRSVKDRLHREHMVSVAEVDALDNMGVAVMALACVGRDGAYVGEILDHVSEKLRSLTDAELGATRRDLIHGKALPEEPAGEAGAQGLALDEELLAYFHDEEEDEDARRPGEGA